MTKFYFHIRDKAQLIEDLEGLDVADLDAARVEAGLAALDLMANEVRKGISPDGRQFEICDESGAQLAVVPFQSSLSPPDQVVIDDRQDR